jgi:outer membrane protein assembly factor BamD
MRRVFVLILMLFAAGCGSSIPLTERLDAEELYNHAAELLAAGRYQRAAEAFERFVFRFPGHPRQPDARYHLAEAFAGRREFLSAANEYLRFALEYPTHARAADARFGACEAYARLSPRHQLDQQYTVAAIEHCESLLMYYPDSEHAAAAQAIIAEMANKLALKQFDVGEHYLRRRAYDSAILSYDEVLTRYPDTPTAPRALLRLIEVYERLGYEQDEEQATQRLLRDYPTSEEARTVQQRTVAGSA